MVNKITGILTLLFAVFVFSAYGQSGRVQGVITDRANGETLPGASVIIEGTTIGSTTGMDGEFAFDAPAGNIVLVASFIGYSPTRREINVPAGQTVTVNFELFPDITLLDEFIVIGYGVQKRSDMTGAVISVSGEDMNRGVLSDPIQGLQGKAAGVMITKPGGDPNAGFSVRVRGASSIATSTSPLFVVDGVPGVDPTTISPDDIESFNVLKDASAAAIYGSRGANGVIIITTKRGVAGQKSRVDFNTFYSFDEVANRLDLLSADELRNFASSNNIGFNDGGSTTNWQDEVFRTGGSQNYNVSLSGSENNLAYRASVAHSIFSGVVKGSSKERTTGRLNIDHSAFDDRLIISSGLSGTFERNDYISYSGWGLNEVLYQAYSRNPTDPILNDDGSFHEDTRGFNYRNPMGIIESIYNQRDAKRYFGYLKADLEIFDGLVAGVNLAYTRDDHENFYFEPANQGVITREGEGSRNYDNYETRLLETTLRYNTQFDLHTLEVLGGYSFQEDFRTGFFARGRKPFLNVTGPHDLSIFQDINPGGDINSWKESHRLISFFGRAIYNFDSKYYLTGTLRRDGSSKFGKNNEWGWFPSASAMWNITGEDFMSNASVLNNLRLRAGVGLTGNQEFRNYLGIQYYESAGNTLNFETGEDAILFRFAHDANPNLKWEENFEVNIGVDYGLFNDRISGSVEYFVKNTYDLLGEYSVPVPPYARGRIWANVGDIQVKGMDMMIQAFPVNLRNIEWRTSVSFSTFTQRVISLGNEDFEWSPQRIGNVSGPGLVGTWTQIVEPGKDIGTWYMPEFAGIQTDGAFLFYTEAGGVTRNPELAERRVVGSALPDFELGWSNYLTLFRNWDVSFAFRGVFGHDVFNATKLIFGNPTTLPSLNGLKVAVEEYERGLRDFPKVSSYYLEDGSFIRLDNLAIGYNLRNIRGFNNIRVYFASNNVFTITNYTGIDPEISFTGLSFGLDQFNVYPKVRTLTFGINASI
jgi:TonB-dependent starch-binding outer membrane protein SusC